jgi:hypothetical protein
MLLTGHLKGTSASDKPCAWLSITEAEAKELQAHLKE